MKKKIQGLYQPVFSLACAKPFITHRIEDRKRVLVDGDDEDRDTMMATEP